MADLTGLTDLVAGDVVEPLSVCQIREYEAEAEITKGQAVYLSSDGKISPATSAQNSIGIAIMSALIGAMCSVITRGPVKVAVGDAIARGQRVYGGDSEGRVLAMADQEVNEGGSATYSIYHSRDFARAEQTSSAAGDLIIINVGA